MAWLENGKLISDAECGELISKDYQYVEGILMSPDKVNDLIRSGYTRPHLSEGLRYTFTSKEARNLSVLGAGALGLGLVSVGTWNVVKSKLDRKKKETL
ncbi:hypothetical protein H0266_18460 [Halobacillus locisalis]|uniref:Uncharacterized protein n=1 Tax=Halobacillus locisalis TaxID=220753 RepID=A0A838CZZ0_9BACI|nr:hypothetical protein [Halobacillus locisalis]MBA2176866.1 hypothetical protein [Halobacillus locisalis]